MIYSRPNTQPNAIKNPLTVKFPDVNVPLNQRMVKKIAPIIAYTAYVAATLIAAARSLFLVSISPLSSY